MAARTRLGSFHERPRLFASAPDQAVVGHGFDDALGDERILVLQSLRNQPVEVLQTAVRVESNLGSVSIRTAGCEQVLVKILSLVREARGFLNRRAAVTAEVDLSAGER